MRLTVESNSCSLIVTIHDELAQFVAQQIANLQRDRPSQFVTLQRELFQFVQSTIMMGDGASKCVVFHLQSRHIPQVTKFRGERAFEVVVVKTQLDFIVL